MPFNNLLMLGAGPGAISLPNLPASISYALDDVMDTTNLMAYYLHPEANADTWEDLGPNSLDLTKQNNVTRGGSVGDYWVAPTLGGFSNSLRRAHEPAFDIGSSDFMACIKFRVPNLDSNFSLAGHQNGWFIRTNGSNDQLYVIFYAGGLRLASLTGLVANQWHTVFIRKEGSTLYASLDDGAEQSVDLTTATIDSYTTPFDIGSTYASYQGADIEKVILSKHNPSVAERARIKAFVALKHDEYYITQANTMWTSDKVQVFSTTDFNAFNTAAMDTRSGTSGNPDTTYIGSSNSNTMINNSYRLRTLMDWWYSTMDHVQLNEALDLVEEYIDGARASSTFNFTNAYVTQTGGYTSGATSSRLSWRSRGGGLSGEEAVLFEGYFAGVVAELLYLMKQASVHTHPTYSARYSTILSFWEDNYWSKWYERGTDSAGSGTLIRGAILPAIATSGVHMTSHAVIFAEFMRLTSTDATLITQYNYLIDEYYTNVADPPVHMQGDNLLDALEDHITLGASAIMFPQTWNTTTVLDPEDTSHAWHVFRAVYTNFALRGGVSYVSSALLDRFGAFLTGYTINNHPVYMNEGSGSVGSGFGMDKYQLVTQFGQEKLEWARYVDELDPSVEANELDSFGARLRNRYTLLSQ